MRVSAFVLVASALVAGAGCVAAESGEAITAAEQEARGVLLVANKRGNSLSRIDLATGRESGRAETCPNPHELSVSPDGRHVAVACYAGTWLEIYAVADLSRAATIELGEGAEPHGVVWHQSGMIVATAEGRGSLFVVADPLGETPHVTEIGSGEPGGRDGPHLVAVDEAGAFAWGSVIPSAAVVRYDLRNGTLAGEAVLSGETEAIALSPDGADVWVGANSGNRAYRLDATTLVVEAEVPVGAMPIRVALHPSGRWAVTSNLSDGSLSVIDARSAQVTRTIEVSGRQDAGQVTLVFSGDGSRLYAAETFADTIAEVDFASGAVLRRLPTGPGGDGLAIVD
jgi:DNA-binding beta-propeller fold protein YncE